MKDFEAFCGNIQKFAEKSVVKVDLSTLLCPASQATKGLRKELITED